MPDAFKNQLNPEVIAHMALHLERAGGPLFAKQRFVDQATSGLDALELKQRVVHIRRAVHACLPDDFAAAATIIEQALMPVPGTPRPWELNQADSGISSWGTWPLTDYVAHHGLAHPERALRCLHALTQRFTAEFAIRPFLQQHPELTLATLQLWLEDNSEHVRRLVSEGTRPRLPWGLRLTAFVADPAPCLPLLDRLYQDPSEYVRRSVANHLNDISKDHPDLAVAVAERWLADGSAATRRLVQHALRTLIKQGHGGALRLLGFGAHEAVHVAELSLSPTRVPHGETLHFAFTLCNAGNDDATLNVDYAIWHQRANGTLSPKVFKLSRVTLPAGATRRVERSHSLRPVTTRRYYPGAHALELLVNGERMAWADFTLLPAE